LAGSGSRDFSRNGVDSELLYIPSGATSVQALVAGEVQILSASGGHGCCRQSERRGCEDRRKPGPLEYKPWRCPHSNIEELKGKRVGISRYGSFTDFARRILRHIGMNPEKDVTILQTGLPGARRE
jgi:ABC-type nitrate/sulfonate/bicarbonate transport system substrate-binding protein